MIVSIESTGSVPEVDTTYWGVRELVYLSVFDTEVWRFESSLPSQNMKDGDMSTFDAIKAKWMQSRKERSSFAAFLGTLKSDIERVAKDAGRDVTEDDVQRVLKKFAKGSEDVLSADQCNTVQSQRTNLIL